MSYNPHIATSFSHAASRYDQVAFLQREIGEILFSLVKKLNKTPKNILDLGAGTGFFSQYLASHYTNTNIFSLDKAVGMSHYNQSKHPHPSLHTLCADAFHLPLTSQSIDCLFSNLMIQWCHDLSAALKECQRILSKNGSIFISTLGKETLNELHKSWQQAFGYRLSVDFLSAEQFKNSLKEAGFYPLQLEKYNLCLNYLTVKDLLDELSQLGAGNIRNTNKSGLLGRKSFQLFNTYYEQYRSEDGFLPATYEVIYYHGRLK